MNTPSAPVYVVDDDVSVRESSAVYPLSGFRAETFLARSFSQPVAAIPTACSRGAIPGQGRLQQDLSRRTLKLIVFSPVRLSRVGARHQSLALIPHKPLR